MRTEAVECRTVAVLVFWPPTRGTQWPTAVAAALEAAENLKERGRGFDLPLPDE